MMEKEKYAIITIGNSHFTVPVKNYYHNRGDDIASIILKDGTRLEIGTNNLIIVHGSSELINAMLESLNENFYQPEKDQHGKTKMKKITQDRPFKLIKGGKNE